MTTRTPGNDTWASRYPGQLAALVIAIIHASALAYVLLGGFTAISDDDYSRVTIAQSFASVPRLDPTATSWLPLPFWVLGGSLKLFGTSLEIARLTSWCFSLLASISVYPAARWFGLRRTAALGCGVLCAVFPGRLWAGAATVPEGFCAGLCLLALASTQQDTLSRRWLGVIAMGMATLSRYEAWPLAVVVGLGFLGQIRNKPLSLTLWPALGAGLGPLSWLCWGRLAHGDALFFVARVANYRQALGQSSADNWLGVLSHYPLALVRAEPELSFLLVTMSIAARGRSWIPAVRFIAFAVCAVFAFLMYGDWRDGAPTHHVARTLLPVWFLLNLLIADRIDQAARALLARWAHAREGASPLEVVRVAVWPVAWLFGLAFTITCRAWLAPPSNFADRRAEEDIGRLARPIVGDQRILIDHSDYGYFAIMAALEQPGRSTALLKHDPRQPESDPWSSTTALRQRIQVAQATWLIVRAENLPRARELGKAQVQNHQFALLKLNSTE